MLSQPCNPVRWTEYSSGEMLEYESVIILKICQPQIVDDMPVKMLVVSLPIVITIRCTTGVKTFPRRRVPLRSLCVANVRRWSRKRVRRHLRNFRVQLSAQLNRP